MNFVFMCVFRNLLNAHRNFFREFLASLRSHTPKISFSFASRSVSPSNVTVLHTQLRTVTFVSLAPLVHTRWAQSIPRATLLHHSPNRSCWWEVWPDSVFCFYIAHFFIRLQSWKSVVFAEVSSSLFWSQQRLSIMFALESDSDIFCELRKKNDTHYEKTPVIKEKYPAKAWADKEYSLYVPATTFFCTHSHARVTISSVSLPYVLFFAALSFLKTSSL